MKNINELLEEYKNVHLSMGMLDDVKFMHKFATENKFMNILELGILHGNSTRAFAIACSETGGHLTSVDIEPACIDEVYQKIKDDGTLDFVTFKTADSIDFLYHQPDGYWDCIFIDTSHLLLQTIGEIFLAAQKVKQNGGYLLLHDTNQEGVDRALKLFLQYNSKCVTFQNHYTNAGLGVIVTTGGFNR